MDDENSIEEYYLASFPEMVDGMNLLRADVNELMERLDRIEDALKEIENGTRRI